MATYAIGDVQGCMHPLQDLLEKIAFNPVRDTLWFTGDLINRGPLSLDVLRFVANLGDKHVVVLGNHDLHLLAVVEGNKKVHPNDTLQPILDAKDRDDLIFWLRHRSLLHYDAVFNCVMSHAGIAPIWSLQKAIALAKEVEAVLGSNDYAHFLQAMYGDQPKLWQDDLTGNERLRCIVNYLTRMRFCEQDGALNLTYKGTIANAPVGLTPWFLFADRIPIDAAIVFGHWAALGGVVSAPNIFALDTGCVWGHRLTAIRLEDRQRFSVPCQRPID